jgi:hypothetical protein
MAAVAKMAKAGTRFLIFMTRVSPDCAKRCRDASALQHPCHGAYAF